MSRSILSLLFSILYTVHICDSSLVCYDWMIEFRFANTWITANDVENTIPGQQATSVIAENIKTAMLTYYATTYFIVQQPLTEPGSTMEIIPEGASGTLIMYCGFVGKGAQNVVDNIETAILLPDFYLLLNASTAAAVNAIDSNAVLTNIIVYDYNSTYCQSPTTLSATSSTLPPVTFTTTSEIQSNSNWNQHLNLWYLLGICLL
eukprot:774831_1